MYSQTERPLKIAVPPLSIETTLSVSFSLSEMKSQVFLEKDEDIEIINSGIEQNYQISSIKEQIRNLMPSEILQEVVQQLYDLAVEGQNLAIASIDTFSYIIEADSQGEFLYMDDEARVLNITCFKQDIEMQKMIMLSSKPIWIG